MPNYQVSQGGLRANNYDADCERNLMTASGSPHAL